MSVELSRAYLLREHGRHEEAVAMILSHLALHPEDPDALLELSINRLEIPGQLANALENARQASGITPDDPFPLALQARILCRLDRPKEALALAESAIALDPDVEFSWISKSMALADLSRWAEAETAARQALEIDPDNEAASNMLSHTLRLQNRLSESEEESARRLSRNPENPFSFANSGWAALQRGEIQKAEALFLEALRLSPDMEYARHGLKEAYRARSGFYRIFLKWSFFLTRFSQENRMAIIIGMLVGFKVLKSLFAAVHPLLVIPLVVVYYLFVFGTFIFNGLANLFVLSDARARLSLDLEEKIEGIVLGILFLGGLVAGLVGLSLGWMPLAIGGAAMMVAAIPASMIFTNPSRVGRVTFSALTLTVLGASLGMVIEGMKTPSTVHLQGTTGILFTIGTLAAVASTWLSSVPALRSTKEK